MEVEKAFDISIPDKEAEKIITVGDFHDVVWKHLAIVKSSKCNTQLLFYKLRNYFTTTFNGEKKSFKPNSLINELFPEENRRNRYKDFETTIQLRLPPLILPKSWNSFLHLVGMVSVGGGFLYALFTAEFYSQSRWNYLIPVVGIVFTSLLSSLLNFKRVIISPFTVRDFTEKTLALNYRAIAETSGANRKDVEMVINYIISEKIGLDLDEILPEKKIGDDLGVS